MLLSSPPRKGFDDLPSEVVHAIFKTLHDFKSVAALRRQGTRYAAIGGEYLISRIRFHTSEESLKRLKHFANHPAICKNIDTISYEGNLLGHRSLRSYQAHFREVHHAGEAPIHPGEGASGRALRLHNRNKEKHEKQILDDYKKHDAAYEQQRLIFQGELMQEAVASLVKFPKLKHISLSTATRCAHALSGRFQQAFDLSCRMPVDLCSRASVAQLRGLILPGGIPLRELLSLHVHALSPRFFSKMSTKQSVLDVFRSLKSIRIVFRLEEEQRVRVESTGPEAAYSALNKSYLHEALATARGAESILVNFDDLGYYGPVTNIRTIMGSMVWPQLKSLDLDCIKFGGDVLVQTLKRQPSLKNVTLAFGFVSDGTWPQLLRELKEHLNLSTFEVRGLLEDNQNVYATNNIDAFAYEEDHIEIHMSSVIDDFVTGDLWDEDEEFDPFDAFDWQDSEELYEKFGYPDDDSDADVAMSMTSDDDAEESGADDDEKSGEKDDDVPALVPMELD